MIYSYSWQIVAEAEGGVLCFWAFGFAVRDVTNRLTRDIRRDLRKIGDVDEGVVERGEDTGNTENELTCKANQLAQISLFLTLRIGRIFSFLVTYPLWSEGRAGRSPAHRE